MGYDSAPQPPSLGEQDNFLEIIREASKRLPEIFRAKYTQVPWKTMAGLRDVLIHDYLKIDINRVWKIIEINLPELKTQIKIIIDREQSSN